MDCNTHSGIDLHVHSTASDGTLSPLEILVRATRQKLFAVSITDHDTIEGSRAAMAHGMPEGLSFLSGVEISASRPSAYPGPGSFHILGYGIDVGHLRLNQSLSRLQSARRDRNPQIIDRLRHLGVELSLEQLSEKAGAGTQLGRPHIAALMVEKGFAASIDDAFDRYLGAGKPAYVDKYRVGCRKAIELIRESGGLAVLAHPGLLNLGSPSAIEPLFSALKAMGIEGVEAYYPEHTIDQTERFISLAEKLGLLVTGGSDFHGTIKPKVQLGSGYGGFHVPFRVYEQLTARIAERT